METQGLRKDAKASLPEGVVEDVAQDSALERSDRVCLVATNWEGHSDALSRLEREDISARRNEARRGH